MKQISLFQSKAILINFDRQLEQCWPLGCVVPCQDEGSSYTRCSTGNLKHVAVAEQREHVVLNRKGPDDEAEPITLLRDAAFPPVGIRGTGNDWAARGRAGGQGVDHQQRYMETGVHQRPAHVDYFEMISRQIARCHV